MKLISTKFMEQNRHLNTSTLVDLKAELFKKQLALKQAKLEQANVYPKLTSYRHKIKNVSKQKTSVQLTLKETEDNKEENIALQKSRLALEEKAKLYDKLMHKNDVGDYENETFLVNFHKKIIEKVKEQPVDIVTSGTGSKNTPNQINSNSTEQSCKSTSFPSEMTKSQETLENSEVKLSSEDESVHYQNVEFNEVRDYGVGYFSFSKDEKKRKEEMKALNNLRQQTMKRKQMFSDIQESRTKSLEARLSKICGRRNIDRSVISEYMPSKIDAETPSDITLTLDGQNCKSDIELSDIPLPDASNEPTSKPTKVRPWDVGKDLKMFLDADIKRRKENSEAWIDNRRSERIEEFAPPVTYI